MLWVVYMSVMPFSWHCCLIVSGQMLACVSPTWALCRSIMHSLLCPMPPPMDCGSCPLRSRWWKYSCFRFSLPASFNWWRSACVSTRIPIEDSSTACPSMGYHMSRSPLSPGNPVCSSMVV